MQSGIESLSEAELIQKLQVAAQVCTHSLAEKLWRQPRQQFFRHPPSASQLSGIPTKAPPVSESESDAAESPGQIPAAAQSRSSQPAGGEAAVEAAAEAGKPPFNKGKWLGVSQVERSLSKGGRQPVDDRPAASREARAQGYQRMRIPGQVRFTGNSHCRV